MEKNLVRPIQRIDGVADVSFRIRRKGIQIEVDKDRAEAYRLSISQLSRRLRGDNFTLSSGTVIDGGEKVPPEVVQHLSFVERLGGHPGK